MSILESKATKKLHFIGYKKGDTIPIDFDLLVEVLDVLYDKNFEFLQRMIYEQINREKVQEIIGIKENDK